MNYMYGLECEFELKFSDKLFNSYKPDSLSVPIWLEMPFHEKLEYLNRTSVQVKNRTPWLKLIVEDHPNLPPYLIRDDTGNLELVFAPVKSQSRLYLQIDLVKSLFGNQGIFQATVSLPATDFFNQDHRNLLGWFQFYGEKDFLEKLHYSAQKNKSLTEPRNHWGFMEPFLGPLTDYKANRLRKALKYQSRGEWWTKEALDFLSLNASSSKYVGSTVYRPDLAGPERICLEVRDTHKNISLLKSRIDRIQKFFPNSLSQFKIFNDCPHMSYALDFQKLPLDVQDLLRKQISHHVPDGLEKFSRVKEVYEVFRRFAYPLRDWEPWLRELGAPEASNARVRSATESYLASLKAFASLPSEKSLSSALTEALLIFTEESDLYHLFENWESLLTSSDLKINHQEIPT